MIKEKIRSYPEKLGFFLLQNLYSQLDSEKIDELDNDSRDFKKLNYLLTHLSMTESLPEWPFDITILFQLFISALLPIINPMWVNLVYQFFI